MKKGEKSLHLFVMEDLCIGIIPRAAGWTMLGPNRYLRDGQGVSRPTCRLSAALPVRA